MNSNKRKRDDTHKGVTKRRRTMPPRPKTLPPNLRSSFTEIKAFDFGATTSLLSTSALIYPLNLPIEGSGYFNRIGRKIEMKSLHFFGICFPSATEAGPDYGRVMIIYDAQTNGALPAITDILLDANATGSTTSLSGINLNNRERFTILRDIRLELPAVTDTAGVITNYVVLDPIKESFNFNAFLKLGNLNTHFKASSGAITDIATGGLYAVFYSLSAGSHSCTWNARLRYKD